MAKKNKPTDRERDGFLFEEGAGTEEELVDLFNDDEPDPDEADGTAIEDGSEAEPDEGSDTADMPVKDEEDKIPSSVSSTFHFDRYGRRIDKNKNRYGKRKNAPKATTTVVEHDTEAKREYDEARARAEERAKIRAKEEARQRALKKAEKQKQRKRSLSTALFGVLAVALLLAMVWFVTRLTTVRVADVPDGYTEQDIVTLSKLKRGRSMLFQSTVNAEKAIESDPYLEATVQYSFPSTVRIAVTKRAEAACVRWGPQNEYLAIIDEKGTVLNEAAESAGTLLIAEGMSISNAANGTRLGDPTDTRVAALIRILTKLKELGLLSRSPRISRIDMTELMQIRIYTEGTSYTIEVGDPSNLDTKLMLLQKHWDEIMNKAAEYVRNGHATATIYLYAKGGVSISPYEPGYSYVAPVTTYLPETPQPQETPEGGDEPDESPEPTTPSVTPMPHQNDPFTG